MKHEIKVLLIEEIEGDLMITSELLKSNRNQEYNVEVVRNYDDGLAALLECRHDVCLLDYNLGPRTGLGLIRTITATHCRTPMILLTADGSRDIDIKAAKAGATDFLIKSEITTSILERSIRYAIERGQIKESRDSAIEAARLKSEFLANMSHEIRTPMNGIVGMTHLLLDSNLDDEQKELAKTVSVCADSLLTIISDILDLSKMEAGKLNFESLDFDPRHAIESAVQQFESEVQAKGIELAVNVDESVSSIVRGDAVRLRQVLTNLIGNAVKFTEKGEVIIGVTQSETEKHHVLNFTIKDTGIGIPTDARGKLFQAFMQADGSTTRKYGGTGLGLAISKQLVELMNGEISFESEEGTGTRFSFTAQMDKQSVKAKKTVLENSALKGLRVLIVHGNAFHRSLLAHQTRGWQMITEECGDLNGAVEMIEGAANENKPYNLALIELQNVGSSSAFERLMKEQKELRKVLISVPGQPVEDQTARRLGAGACLTLPVREEQLFNSLATVMSKKAARSAFKAVENFNGYSPEKAKSKKHLNILVAEDHAINQSVAVRQLRKLGHITYVVSDGLEALAALEERDYDIVLMDCQMPNLDGYQATRAVRRNEGSSKHTVIIAMTANAMAGDREKCVAAGMDDYITKPIIAAELDLVLRKWSWPSSVKEENGRPERPPLLAAEPVERTFPIDLDRLIDATGENGRVPTEFIDLYQAQMAEELERLQDAIRTDSAEDLKCIAHGSAGMNANCGMTAVVAPLLELERMGMSGQLTHAGEVADQVQLGFNEICSYLERMPERV